MRLPLLLTSPASFLLEALFPRSCYGCGRSDTYLCCACCEVVMLPEPLCPHCGTRLPFGLLSAPCRRALGLERLFCASAYTADPMRSMIGTFKYRRAHALADPLAALMLQWLRQKNYLPLLQSNSTVVVPVPSHRARQRERGFNPAQRLAESLSSQLELPLESSTLTKTRNNPQQAGLPQADRQTNVAGAFTLSHPESLRNKRVILVDDVLTTGATLRECAKTLHSARPKEIWALVLAKD